jgi:hypothetical protein
MSDRTIDMETPQNSDASSQNRTSGSLDAVVKPLPVYVQEHLYKIEAENKLIGFEADPEVSRHMAWRRWGKAHTNSELCELLMTLRNYLYAAEDSTGAIMLEECAWRIKKRLNAQAQRPRKTNDMNEAKTKLPTKRGFTEARGYAWKSVSKSHPADGQRVICKYAGVYDARIVTFWRDAGGNPHFGIPSEPDGKGSQPATHWTPLP